MTHRGKSHVKRQPSKIFVPVEYWPEPDQAIWERACHIGGPLDDGGRAAGWRPRTRKKVVSDYGRWIGWLKEFHADELLTPPLDRVTRERVKMYAAHLTKRVAPYTVQLHLQGLGAALGAISDGPEYRWIFRAANRMGSRAKSVKNKRAKLQPMHKIIELGFRLMKTAEERPDEWHSPPAAQFRTGLMIALLGYRPVRAANFSSIHIGKQLRKSGSGWCLVFDADETKQKRLVEVSVPACLSASLERYLTVYRPAMISRGPFGKAAGQALWVGRDGGPMGSQGISDAIRRETKNAFGTAIGPHFFRDIAATTIATSDPGNASGIAPILGHSSPTTSERHYNHAQMIDAGYRLHAVVRSKRRIARRSSRLKQV